MIGLDLTHLPLAPHICVNESGQHWFRQWLVAYSVPSHYLNQCWVIVNWTLRNKFQWNCYQNTKLFIHENVSENIICEMAAILSRGDELIAMSYQISIVKTFNVQRRLLYCARRLLLQFYFFPRRLVYSGAKGYSRFTIENMFLFDLRLRKSPQHWWAVDGFVEFVCQPLGNAFKSDFTDWCLSDQSVICIGIVSGAAWWRHQIETFSALLALCAGNSPVTGEFPTQRPVTRTFDVFFDLRLNNRLSKQSWGWWFETPSCSLWRHCNMMPYWPVSDLHQHCFWCRLYNGHPASNQTNAELLWNLCEICIQIRKFSFKNMHLNVVCKMTSILFLLQTSSR